MVQNAFLNVNLDSEKNFHYDLTAIFSKNGDTGRKKWQRRKFCQLLSEIVNKIMSRSMPSKLRGDRCS